MITQDQKFRFLQIFTFFAEGYVDDFIYSTSKTLKTAPTLKCLKGHKRGIVFISRSLRKQS